MDYLGRLFGEFLKVLGGTQIYNVLETNVQLENKNLREPTELIFKRGVVVCIAEKKLKTLVPMYVMTGQWVATGLGPATKPYRRSKRKYDNYMLRCE